MRNCVKVNIRKTSTKSNIVFDIHTFINDNQSYTNVYCSNYKYEPGDTCIEFDAPLMFNNSLAQMVSKTLANRLSDIRSKTDKTAYNVSSAEFPEVLFVINSVLEGYQLSEKTSYQDLQQYINKQLEATHKLMPQLVEYVNATGDFDLVNSPLNNFFNRFAIYQWLIIGGNLTKIIYDDEHTYVVGRMLDKIPVEWCTKNVVQCSTDIVPDNTVYESDTISEKALLSNGHTHKINLPNLFTVEPYNYYN